MCEIGEHEIPLYPILPGHDVFGGGEEIELWRSWCWISQKFDYKKIQEVLEGLNVQLTRGSHDESGGNPTPIAGLPFAQWGSPQTTENKIIFSTAIFYFYRGKARTEMLPSELRMYGRKSACQ